MIALFAFEKLEDEVKISTERHYKLVDPGKLTDEDLVSYRRRV